MKKWEEIKDKLQLRVINTEKNWEVLGHVPHFHWNDLSCICVLAEEKAEQVEAMVTDSFLQLLGVGKKELFKAALCNTIQKQQPQLQKVNEILREMGGFESGMEEEPPLYCLSSKKRWMGAWVLAYPKILEKAAEAIGAEELYLLPSSCHEVLLLPKTGNEDAELLGRMVREVNQTIQKEEVLSDHVYLFDRKCRKTVIAA